MSSPNNDQVPNPSPIEIGMTSDMIKSVIEQTSENNQDISIDRTPPNNSSAFDINVSDPASQHKLNDTDRDDTESDVISENDNHIPACEDVLALINENDETPLDSPKRAADVEFPDELQPAVLSRDVIFFNFFQIFVAKCH